MKRGASASADRAAAAGAVEPISVVSSTAGIPCASGLVDDLLHPLRGVERGLISIDGADKIIGIKVGELRKIAACLRAVKREFDRTAGLYDALAALEPHLDAIVCYTSTMGEHEPNRLVVNARAALAKAVQQ